MITRSQSLRTDAERIVFPTAASFSATNELSSPPESAFFDVLPRARLSILHRLAGSLLREPLADLRGPFVSSETDVDVTEKFPEVASSALRNVTLRAPGNTCRLVAALGFPGGGTMLMVPLAGVYGFDRFEPVGHPEVHTPEGARAINHPLDLTELLRREGCTRDVEQVERFESELAESVANLALARLARMALSREMGTTEVLRGAFAGTLPGPDATTFLERLAAIEERPSQPIAKIRRGMPATESLAYAPEFTDRIDLRFVAVRRGEVLQAHAGNEPAITPTLFSRFDGLRAQVERSLPSTADVGEFVVFPVHPWQFHHRLPSEAANPSIVPVEGYTAAVAPLLNLRTVVPYPTPDGADRFPHIKLSIDVRKTSSVRTIPTSEIHDGPRMTDVLREIVEIEEFESLGFLYETAAASYQPFGKGDRNDEAGALAALLRTNPARHRFVDDDSVVVTAASLLSPQPAADRPLVSEFIDRFGRSKDTDYPPAGLAFLEAYLDVVLPEQLLLLSKYGISLDMHLQNTCMVFDRDAVPKAAIFRDFGGIRLLSDRLAAHDIMPDLAPDSAVVAGESMVYRNLLHSTLQTHVGELVRTLVQHVGVEEADCWSRVRRRYRATFEELRENGDVPVDWLARDEAALFADAALHTSRMAMRLLGHSRERAAVVVSNPLVGTGVTEENRL